jgi:hypothetical protein
MKSKCTYPRKPESKRDPQPRQEHPQGHVKPDEKGRGIAGDLDDINALKTPRKPKAA